MTNSFPRAPPASSRVARSAAFELDYERMSRNESEDCAYCRLRIGPATRSRYTGHITLISIKSVSYLDAGVEPALFAKGGVDGHHHQLPAVPFWWDSVTQCWVRFRPRHSPAHTVLQWHHTRI